MKNFKFGFTLAEVLITLAIIGVVAALTLPTLVTNYKEKETVTRLKKTQAVLTEAFRLAEAEHGPIAYWGIKKTDTGEVDEEENPIYDYSGPQLVIDRITKHLNVARVCKAGEICETRDVYKLNGDIESIGSEAALKQANRAFYLTDGTFILMGWANPTDIGMHVTLQGKNIVYGKNRFVFNYDFNKHTLLPEGYKANSSFKSTCNPNSTGRSCTYWVMEYGNMDYLRCPDKLSLNGSHSCRE